MLRLTQRPAQSSLTQLPNSVSIHLRETFGRRLQPILLIIRCALALDDVEGVDDPALLAEILLALVEQIAVDED